jgi:acyl carrier protein
VSTNTALVRQIHELVSTHLGVDPAELRSDVDIAKDLGADSLDVVELVMALEETFDIEVSDEDAESMVTLGDVEKYVADKVAA